MSWVFVVATFEAEDNVSLLTGSSKLTADSAFSSEFSRFSTEGDFLIVGSSERAFYFEFAYSHKIYISFISLFFINSKFAIFQFLQNLRLFWIQFNFKISLIQKQKLSETKFKNLNSKLFWILKIMFFLNLKKIQDFTLGNLR